MSNLNYNYPNLVANGSRSYSISKIGEKGANRGFLMGKNVMPMKFNPSANGNFFSMNRKSYSRSGGKKKFGLFN